MRPKTLPLLEQCIEVGVKRGWHRAHKHNDSPDEDTIINEIEHCVMSEIYEWFDFEDMHYE